LQLHSAVKVAMALPVKPKVTLNKRPFFAMESNPTTSVSQYGF
jgi:hypothetical protein